MGTASLSVASSSKLVAHLFLAIEHCLIGNPCILEIVATPVVLLPMFRV